jgi:hypothetical protein
MLGPQIARKPVDQANVYTHSRSRTTSSNNPVPPQGHLHEQYPSQHLGQPQHYYQHNRRSPSVNTFSTSSSIPPPAAYRKSSASDLHRSESNRSAGTNATSNSGSGYVALLRKQKATVWCDQAQYEDPRIVAQQRAAKKRANLEVTGNGRPGYTSTGSRTNTGISATGKMTAKIRHHGKIPMMGLTPGENHVGVGGVPLRLSATEVEAESSDDENHVPLQSRAHHRRAGSSGRSSIASGRRVIPYRSSGGPGSLHSQRRSPGDTPERSGSIVEDPTGEAIEAPDESASTKARSIRSGSSAERADNVGDLNNAPRLASNSLMHSALTREKSVKSPEELKRRGSVDERKTTFTSQRLYIANPD